MVTKPAAITCVAQHEIILAEAHMISVDPSDIARFLKAS